MKQLDPANRVLLLAIARCSIGAAVSKGLLFEPDDDTLTPPVREPAATFVTLHEQGELRGCIGLMRFDVPMWMNVRDAAPAAAIDDPRFLRVAPAELPSLEIEISVLEQPVPLSDPAGFEAGRHGIVVERGMRRGLLLPQVAPEMGWGREQMLDAVCHKAGLPGDAWRDSDTRLAVFESYCFSEAEVAGKGVAVSVAATVGRRVGARPS